MAPTPSELYIGLMSGTSLDGVDAAAVEFDDRHPLGLSLLAHCHVPYPEDTRALARVLNSSGPDELHHSQLLSNKVSRLYAAAVAQLLRELDLPVSSIRALGAHGQTVRHRPGEFDGNGYTVQLINGALLAELSGIDVVCDFRSRDVAAGGQGAPLVPAFHAAIWRSDVQDIAIANIGGMANVTLLGQQGELIGFDTGPGNVLLDAWCQLHQKGPYDAGGAWGATGQPLPALLEALLSEPFFHQPPPKSTGRDLFELAWLQASLARTQHQRAAPERVQATLVELTASTLAQAITQYQPDGQLIAVCGGGAFNDHLLDRIRAHAPNRHIATTHSLGLDPQHVEAIAFAWLARAFEHRQPGNHPAVTGAKGFRILGAKHPAT